MTEQKNNISITATLRGVSATGIAGSLSVTEESDIVKAEGVIGAGITVKGYIIPERRTADGILVKGVSQLWIDIVEELKGDWDKAYKLGDREWEELIGGAFKKQGYDEVTVTPHRGDFGRDVIAIKHGFGTVKLLNSMKAYNKKLLVTAAEVRELAGVLNMDHSASKGIFTTTSDFAPELLKDPGIAAMVPTRLELLNGSKLQAWLKELSDK
jgi:restriction system protein